jgi:hypothetical protein
MPALALRCRRPASSSTRKFEECLAVEQPHDLPAEVLHEPLRVVAGEQGAGGLCHQIRAQVTPAQRGFRLFAVRDVGEERTVVHEGPVTVELRLHEQLDGQSGAVLAQVLLLVADRLAGLHRFGQPSRLALAPLGRCEVRAPGQLLVLELPPAVAGEVRESLIEEEQAAVGGPDLERDVGGLHHVRQEALALRQNA